MRCCGAWNRAWLLFVVWLAWQTVLFVVFYFAVFPQLSVTASSPGARFVVAFLVCLPVSVATVLVAQCLWECWCPDQSRSSSPQPQPLYP